ncbi:hypothetical protein [Thalassobaculum sp.]|uniref:hypothetical protein n=1 Tax=Thalassobaculum sp. TaxID=2022740 RepID=UPI003B5AA0C4
MLDVVKLVMPALFPSWRFFDVIAPSPRIELALADTPDTEPPADDPAWRECRPLRARLGPVARVVSFFWNPHWNETLYLATCAERLMQDPSEHSSREIRRRLRRDLAMQERAAQGRAAPYFRFRLVFVSREGARLRRDVAYVSPAYPTLDPQEP